jgi:hypothetical protein
MPLLLRKPDRSGNPRANYSLGRFVYREKSTFLDPRFFIPSSESYRQLEQAIGQISPDLTSLAVVFGFAGTRLKTPVGYFCPPVSASLSTQ